MSYVPSGLVISSSMSPRAAALYAGNGRAIQFLCIPEASSTRVEAVNETSFCDLRMYVVFVLRYVPSQVNVPGTVVIVGRFFACPVRLLVRHPEAAFFVFKVSTSEGITTNHLISICFATKPRKARTPLYTRRCMYPCVSACCTASSPASMLAPRRGKIGDLRISRDRNSRRFRQGGG